MKNEILNIFANIGFDISDGPEIEDDWHNFTALNLPEYHPARDMQDTFFIQTNPDILLPYSYKFGANTLYGKSPASYPNYISGACIPQRSYICTFALFVSPSRRLIHR